MAGRGLQASACLQTALLLAVRPLKCLSAGSFAPPLPLPQVPFQGVQALHRVAWGRKVAYRPPPPPLKSARQMQSLLTSYLVGSISHSAGSQLPPEPRLTAVRFFSEPLLKTLRVALPVIWRLFPLPSGQNRPRS